MRINQSKLAVLIVAGIAVALLSGGCMYTRQARQSEDEHYKHETRISDRAVLDRNAR
ncbi:MAG: hypothetical protein HQL20_08645 [Candidatus Omnitrophica bacterium]|nr:hypothetical protein [Candidatus Omnitrophota bacterium]